MPSVLSLFSVVVDGGLQPAAFGEEARIGDKLDRAFGAVVGPLGPNLAAHLHGLSVRRPAHDVLERGSLHVELVACRPAEIEGQSRFVGFPCPPWALTGQKR